MYTTVPTSGLHWHFHVSYLYIIWLDYIYPHLSFPPFPSLMLLMGDIQWPSLVLLTAGGWEVVHRSMYPLPVDKTRDKTPLPNLTAWRSSGRDGVSRAPPYPCWDVQGTSLVQETTAAVFWRVPISRPDTASAILRAFFPLLQSFCAPLLCWVLWALDVVGRILLVSGERSPNLNWFHTTEGTYSSITRCQRRFQVWHHRSGPFLVLI